MDRINRFSHKDPLIYGFAFFFWGVISYVELESYSQPIELAIYVFLLTSLLALLVIGT